MLERGARLLGGWGFWSEKNDLTLLWPPSRAASLHLLEPNFIGRFLSGVRQKKGTESFSCIKNSVKSFKNRFPVYLLKKTVAFSYKNTISPFGPGKGLIFPQFDHLRNRKKKQ